MVNHQIKQSEGSYAPAVASEVQGMMDTMVQNYALTSQQISDTLYSGGGLPQVGAPAMTDTFAGQVSNLQTISKAMLKETADQTQWLAAGTLVQNTLDSNGNSIFQSMSSTQFQNFEASVTKSADELAQTASEVSTAFNNGTLSIEKATDVNGLNYSETDTWNVNGGTMSTGGSSVTSNYSLFDPSADGTQHTGLNVGGVELYLSWNEPASAST
jgi:hypothetical protein